MARIIIIANSFRYDGRCIAGIDADTYEVVRPVPSFGDGGVPEARCFIDGKFIQPLDVIEMDLAKAPRERPKYQRENRTIRNWEWKRLGRVRFSTLEQFVDQTSPVLHTASDRVSPVFLDKLDQDQWQSLQLIQPSRLTFNHHYFQDKRWVANFRDSKGNDYTLKIADPVVTRLLDAEKEPEKGSLLTVSLPKAWAPKPTPGEEAKAPMCYKVIAAVIQPPA